MLGESLSSSFTEQVKVALEAVNLYCVFNRSLVFFFS